VISPAIKAVAKGMHIEKETAPETLPPCCFTGVDEPVDEDELCVVAVLVLKPETEDEAGVETEVELELVLNIEKVLELEQVAETEPETVAPTGATSAAIMFVMVWISHSLSTLSYIMMCDI